MILVARCLERVGDNTVDIAEQVVFVVTGLFREMADRRRSHSRPRLSRAFGAAAAVFVGQREAGGLATGPMTRRRRASKLLGMPARPPQIVAFGGGGFSMEWGNPLLDDHVLALSGVARPKVCFLPTASGDADHYVVRFYRAFAAPRCEPSHISLFRRETGRGRPPRAPARPGPDLRRRRQPGVADGDLAGARDRSGAVRGVAGRGGAVRRLGGLAVLVLARRLGLSRGAGPASGGPGLPALEQTRCTTATRRAGARPSRRRRRRDAARLRRRRRGGAALRRHRSGRGGLLAARGARPLRVPDGRGGAIERELAVRYLAGDVRRKLPSWRWVARRWRRDAARPAAAARDPRVRRSRPVRHPGGW